MEKRKVIAIQIERKAEKTNTCMGSDALMKHHAYQALAMGNFKDFAEWFKNSIHKAREIASEKIKPKPKETTPSTKKEESHEESQEIPPAEELIKKLTELDELFQILHQYLLKNGYVKE